MQGFMRLTMNTGKQLRVPPHAIEIVESIPQREETRGNNAFTGVWVRMPGMQAVQTAVLSDKFGHVMKMAGGGRKRITLLGLQNQRYSVPVDIITGCLEAMGNPERGLPEGTIIYTSIVNSVGQPVQITVTESCDEIDVLCGSDEAVAPAADKEVDEDPATTADIAATTDLAAPRRRRVRLNN